MISFDLQRFEDDGDLECSIQDCRASGCGVNLTIGRQQSKPPYFRANATFYRMTAADCDALIEAAVELKRRLRG